jgi:hypothetical protein
MVDSGVGFIFVIHYLMQIFIAQNRCQYFISVDSILELAIILPLFIFSFGCSKVGLLLKAFSRLIRLYKIQIFLKGDNSNEDSNVRDQIKKIATDLVLMLIISAMLF